MVRVGSGSTSQKAATLNPPVLSRPRANPPIPAKRSRVLSIWYPVSKIRWTPFLLLKLRKERGVLRLGCDGVARLQRFPVALGIGNLLLQELEDRAEVVAGGSLLARKRVV